MRTSRIVGKDELIKAKLEEGYSFQLLSKELGIAGYTLINYVKGMNSHYKRKYPGISFRKPSTLRDLAKSYGIPKQTAQDWLRKGRIKGKKVGHRLVITEWPSQADLEQDAEKGCHSMCKTEKSKGCGHLEKLKGKPEECSPEQIRECHGEVKGLLAISYCANCLYR